MNNDFFIPSGSIILTENCNLECEYCYENETRCRSKFMSKETAEKTVEFFISQAKLGNEDKISITFFGGEPLMNFPVMEHTFDYALSRCRAESIKFDCMLITNATLFPEGFKEFIIKWHKELGGVNIQLSIDGIPEIIEKNRKTASGVPTTFLIESTVEKYREIKQELKLTAREIHAHSVITKASLPHIVDSYRYIRGLGFETIWNLILPEEDWTEADADLYREQMDSLTQIIYDDCVKENTLKYFDGYSSLNRSATCQPAAPCMAGKKYCSITTDGNIYPCHEFYFVDRDSIIGDVVNGVDDEKRDIFLDYTTKNLFGDISCGDCDNFNCYRCIATQYRVNGNMLIGFPKYCMMARIDEQYRTSLKAKLSEVGLLKGFVQQQCNNSSCGSDDKIQTFLDNMRSILTSIGTTAVKTEEEITSIKEMNIILNQKVDTLLGIVSGIGNIVVDLIKEKEENRDDSK